MSILFTLAIIIYFGCIGFFLLQLLRPELSIASKFFISPLVGIALIILFLFTVSRLGYSIDSFASYLAIASLFGIIITLLYRLNQKNLSYNNLVLFCIAIIFISIFPYAWILYKFGFNWLAFVNGDFSFYSLSSMRFQNYGYSELPLTSNLIDTKDYSLFYWNFPNTMGHRAGAEILLAYIVSVTNLNAHEVYMPLIIALQSAIILGVSALTYENTQKMSFTFVVALLLSFSPLFTIQVNLQLLAQVLGIGQLVFAIILFSKVINTNDIKNIILFTLAFSCLSIVYSEILPFLLLFMFVYILTSYNALFNNQENLKSFIKKVLLFIGLIVVFLNSYLVDVYSFIKLVYFSSSTSANMSVVNNVSLFPLFLTPGYFALVWGILPYGNIPTNLETFIGLMITSLFCIGLICFYKSLHKAVLSMLLILIGVGAYLFFKNHAYGLFKIGMLIQPFLLVAVILLLSFLKKPFITYSIIGVLAITFGSIQYINLKKVSSEMGISPVPYASTHGYISQLKAFETLFTSNAYCKSVLTDSSVREMVFLQSYYFKGIDFITASFGESLHRGVDIQKWVDSFIFLSNIEAKFKNEILVEPKNNYCIILSPKESSIVNNSFSRPLKQLSYQKLNELKNYLIFKQSSISSSKVGNIFSLSSSEKDPLFQNKSIFSAIGRYHLYEVYNFEPRSRMLIALTSTLSKKNNFEIPKVSVVGDSNVSLDTVGKGSARVVTSIVEPKLIGGNSYLGIDFGRDGEYFDSKKDTWMNLYNKDLYLDARKITLFARNISLLNDMQYSIMKNLAPSSIESFPESLMNENLIYSGIFEDGWASDSFYVDLSVPDNTDKPSLTIVGMIPMIQEKEFNTTIGVYIDNEFVSNHSHTVGEFTITLPIQKYKNQSIRLLVKTNNLQKLPNGDDRDVAFLIKKILVK